MKCRFIHTTERTESGFGKAPEALYAINMTVTSDKLIHSMIDSKMLFIPKINEACIAPPAVTMDDTFRVDTSSR